MGISDSLILAVGGAIEKAFWEDTQVCRAIEYGRPFTDETRNALARAAIAAARPMIEKEAFEKAAKVAEAHADGCAQARGNAGAMHDRHGVWQAEAERLASLSIATAIRALGDRVG